MKTIVTAVLAGAIVTASHAGDSPSKPSGNLVETAVAAGSFQTLAAALQAAGLVETLSGHDSFTVFAPTDAAFAELPKGTVEDLLKPENREKLQAILKFHVIPGRVGLSDALKAGEAKTVLGEPVTIGFADGKVRINDASLKTADVAATNGVIHVIDSVLLPPTPKNDIAGVAKRAGQFNTLLAAVDAAGLTPLLAGETDLTVLAPTDAAFKALPKGTVETLLKPENRSKLENILSMHVIKGAVSAGDALNAGSAKSVNDIELKFGIDGGAFEVNGTTIVKTDIKCDNGIIHVIDAVLLPSEKQASQDRMTSGTLSLTQRIETAIKKGVPVFNHGDHGKCADIYRECLEALAKDHALGDSTRQSLSRIMKQAAATHCDTTRAWTLRRGLDQAYQVAMSH